MSGGSGTDMPHWTDPPTGDVPRILADEPVADEDLAAWQALGSRGMRWRDDGDDWDDAPLEDLADDESRVGALDSSRTDHSDLYSFDEDFSRLEEERSGAHVVIGADDDHEPEPEPEVVEVGARAPRSTRSDARATRARQTGPSVPVQSGGDLTNRVVIGAGLLALLLIALAIGPRALVVLAAVVVLASTAEAFGMLQRAGFRPATLLGLVLATGTVLGAYWRGIEALPLGAVLLFGGSMVWYLIGVGEARPLANVAVTSMTYVWTGLLGSFAALLLRTPKHGAGLFVGAIIPAVLADVVAFLVGGRMGSRPLAPHVSPAKTVEGFVAGLVAAVVAGAIVGKEIAPWGGLKHGLLLGLIIGVVAPVGDLFESMVKRDLAVKDSGTVLRSHGGLLDRFDSVLLALPAAYYLATWLKI